MGKVRIQHGAELGGGSGQQHRRREQRSQLACLRDITTASALSDDRKTVAIGRRRMEIPSGSGRQSYLSTACHTSGVTAFTS